MTILCQIGRKTLTQLSQSSNADQFSKFFHFVTEQ